MNQLVQTDQTSTREIGIATGAGGSSIAPQNLGEVVRFAEVMSRADIALPKHLRGNAGACMAVALQAWRWDMEPFAVASKSYSVNGMIAYEAQLIAAVVNTRSGIKGRLQYDFTGEGKDLACKVTGTLDGTECTYETPPYDAIQPKNSPLWKTDPRQQLGYYAARAWARRHCPEVLLGVYDREEAAHIGPDDAKDVTPSVLGRLQARQEPASAREGFDHSFVTRETENLASGQEIQIDEPSAPSSADAGSGENVSPPPATPDPVASAADQAGEPASEAPDEPDAAGSPADTITVELMRECIDNMLREAFSDPKDEQAAKVEKLRQVWLEPQNLGGHAEFVERCARTATRVAGNASEKARAREYLMGYAR